jgi:glycosyltransferase involved in cell wall biosynthesis
MTPLPMLIAVEATRLQREVRGIGRYVRAMLPRLVSQRPGLRLVLFAKTRRGVTALAESVGRDPQLRDSVSVRHVREMARTPADLYWYPWNVVSPVPRRGATVATIHDIAPLAVPDPRLLAWRKNLRWRLRFRRTARVATLIVADSAFTAAEIRRMLGVGDDRIRVALLAADDFAIPSTEGDADALARLGVRAPFVLSVGAAEKRKNHELLARAMRSVVETQRGATLVLAGPRRHATAPSPDSAWMQTLGFVSDADLCALYRNAAALVMPSTYEGFGLPVLEAMRVGTPVICARSSSLPEVAGDAALWVKPDDAEALASAISSVLGDESLRGSLGAGSLRRSGAFSWDETARRTLLAFDEALELHARARPAPVAAQLETAAAPW